MAVLTDTIWKALADNRSLRKALPPGVNELLDKPFAEIQAMPICTESTPPEILCQPRLDFGEITSSYLDFLRREIRVRGKFGGEKVAKLYQDRLDALLPYEHQELYQILIDGMDKGQKRFVIVMFRPDDFGIVHFE